jgi:hypothetical protein
MAGFYVVELPDSHAPLYLSSEGAWVSLQSACAFAAESEAEEHLNLCPGSTIGVVVHSDAVERMVGATREAVAGLTARHHRGASLRRVASGALRSRSAAGAGADQPEGISPAPSGT